MLFVPVCYNQYGVPGYQDIRIRGGEGDGVGVVFSRTGLIVRLGYETFKGGLYGKNKGGKGGSGRVHS